MPVTRSEGRAARKPYKARATLVALFALTAVGGCDQFKRGMHDAARDAAAASIDVHPRDSVIGELQADFPQDYARLREAGAQEAANGGGYAGVRDVSQRFIVAFYAAHEAPAVGCRTGIAVYQGLQTLPPEQAARLQAHLLWGAAKPS